MPYAIRALQILLSGIVNSFLSWGVFAPLSRLTFFMYLIHLDVEAMFFMWFDFTYEFDDLTFVSLNISIFLYLHANKIKTYSLFTQSEYAFIIYIQSIWFIGLLMVITGLAFVATLAFEIPFDSLERMLIGGRCDIISYGCIKC